MVISSGASWGKWTPALHPSQLTFYPLNSLSVIEEPTPFQILGRKRDTPILIGVYDKQKSNTVRHSLFAETQDEAKALATRFNDIENPVSPNVATAFIVYNLLRGHDVEKNIELGANLMLCGRSIEDVFSIAAQEPLSSGVIQYFWPQILKQGDPDSVSRFLKSLYESSTVAQNLVLPSSPQEWIYGQLLALPMDDAASLIHNLLKYGAVDVVNDLLKRLYMDRSDGFEIHQSLFLRYGERFYIDPAHVTHETQIFVVVQSHSNPLLEWMSNPFLSYQKRESRAVLGLAVDDILTECARNLLLKRHHSNSPDDPALIRRITLNLNERIHLASDDEFIRVLDQFLAEDLDAVGLELRITSSGSLQVSEKNEPLPLWTVPHSQEKNVFQTQLVKLNKMNRDFNGSDGVHRQIVSYLLNGQSTMAFYQIIGIELRWSRSSLLRLKGDLFSQLLDGYHYAVDLSTLARKILLNGDLLLQVRFIRALSEMTRLDEYLSLLIKQDESTAKLILRSAAVLGNDDVLGRFSNVYNKKCAENPEAHGLIEFVLSSDDENQEDAESKIIQQKQMSSLLAYEDLLMAMKCWRQAQLINPEMEPRTKVLLAGLTQAATSPQLPLNIRNRFLDYILKQIDRHEAGADVLNLFKPIESTLSDSHKREYLRLRRKQCTSSWPMRIATRSMLIKWVQVRDEHAMPALLEILRRHAPSNGDQPVIKTENNSDKNIDLSWLNEEQAPFEGAALNLYHVELLMNLGVTQFQGVNLVGRDYVILRFHRPVRFDNANFRGIYLVGAEFLNPILSKNGLATQDKPLQGTCLDGNAFRMFLDAGVRDFRGAIFNHEVSIKQIDLRGVDLRDVTWLGRGHWAGELWMNNFRNSTDLKKEVTRGYWLSQKGKRDLLQDTKLDQSSYMALYDSGLRDFSNADLSDVDFSGINLRGVNFSTVHINSILKTRWISLQGTKLDEHALKRLYFAGIKSFRGADFSNTTFTRGFTFTGEVSGIDLTGADFSYAVLEGTDWSHATLEKINFSHAWLHGANFYNSWVVRVNFDGAHVDRDTLSKCAHFRDCTHHNV